jgi:hypothetical protein
MKDPSEWTESDLAAFIENKIQEHLQLDYKRSEALSRKDHCYTELSKDVAAFANSAGGQIIYGIAEKDYLPERIDDGVNATELKREWLEQVISSNIHPKIDGLKIYQIGLPSRGADQVAYVIDIPQSTSRAPHQSRDHRYYKRYNFQSVAMEDYEIRDIMRRATTPDLFIKFRFDSGQSTKVEIRPGAKETSSICLHAEIGNRSNTPAEYAVIDIYLDTFFGDLNTGSMSPRGLIKHGAREFNAFSRYWRVQNQLPIFAEMTLPVETIMFTIRHDLLRHGFDFWIGYAIHAPGFSTEEFAPVILQGGTLFMPPKPGND